MKKNNMLNAGKMPRGAVKPLDLAVLALVLSLTLFSLIPAYGGSGEVRAQVMGGGRSWVFPLAAAERLAVPGPLGET
ncbi:MAG: hypothetical protein LBL44_00005, partial [Treponema sp.]|nr:hypothetical protein [Treponema sp.]